MDVFGQALSDYFTDHQTELLLLHNSYGEPEEMPVSIFFRELLDFPELEVLALSKCYGRVLDVGAGVGSHALFLQKRRFDVTAIDQSQAAVDIMLQRGVKNAVAADFFELMREAEKSAASVNNPDSSNPQPTDRYDTLLFLMNGIGITGTLPGLRDFLSRAHHLLNDGGQLLFDSSDIRYLYEGEELPSNQYYGEISYQYEYKEQKGNWFNWLYIDQHMLSRVAKETGWKYEMLFDDQEDQYLARLTKA